MSDAIFAGFDFLPTFGKIAGYEPPRDRLIEGVDQTDLLTGKSERGARDHYHYFSQNELHAVRTVFRFGRVNVGQLACERGLARKRADLR